MNNDIDTTTSKIAHRYTPHSNITFTTVCKKKTNNLKL